jgi:hypothetical protein
MMGKDETRINAIAKLSCKYSYKEDIPTREQPIILIAPDLLVYTMHKEGE